MLINTKKSLINPKIFHIYSVKKFWLVLPFRICTFMFIDEFDAYYYHELSESIVSMLEKITDTQIIFDIS